MRKNSTEDGAPVPIPVNIVVNNDGQWTAEHTEHSKHAIKAIKSFQSDFVVPILAVVPNPKPDPKRQDFTEWNASDSGSVVFQVKDDEDEMMDIVGDISSELISVMAEGALQHTARSFEELNDSATALIFADNSYDDKYTASLTRSSQEARDDDGMWNPLVFVCGGMVACLESVNDGVTDFVFPYDNDEDGLTVYEQFAAKNAAKSAVNDVFYETEYRERKQKESMSDKVKAAKNAAKSAVNDVFYETEYREKKQKKSMSDKVKCTKKKLFRRQRSVAKQ